MAQNVIDLRSDTITKPTPAMRQAMMDAQVGDDVLGDDPTVAALERRTAELLGKEAAVFMPSGTMTNQVAIRTHTEPGDEIVLEAGSHAYFYEAGAPAAISGVMCRLIEGRRGLFDAGDLKRVLRPANVHMPRTKLVCLENTHNRGGGSIWPLEQIQQVATAAREAGLAMHLDGARLWNASVATGVAQSKYAGLFDSVSVCFSKGLGAPVGSCLAGTGQFIQRARRFRKMLGGGMRQSGILAAAAIYALDHNRGRLVEDHANAKTLAKGLSTIPGIELDLADVETNIVIFRITAMPADELVKRLHDRGVWMLQFSPDAVRAVVCYEASAAQIQQAIEAVREVLS